MPLFDGILNGLLAQQRQQSVRGAFLNNAEKEQGLFESGLQRFRQNQFDEKFADLQAQGLDPLRNSLSLFRNATRPDEAQAALGLFTSLRQPAASASLFDAEATGVPGLGGTATSLTRRGLGGLNGALQLEQQDRALALSGVNNPGLALGRPSVSSGVGADVNQELINRLGSVQDVLAQFVGREQAAALTGTQQTPQGTVVRDPQGNVLTDPGLTNVPSRTTGGPVPNNLGTTQTVESTARGVKTAMNRLEAAQARVALAKSVASTSPQDMSSYEREVRIAEMALEKAKIEREMALASE